LRGNGGARRFGRRLRAGGFHGLARAHRTPLAGAGEAVACVGLLKSSGDEAAIDGAKRTYGIARAEMDGVVDGLVIALVDGGKPESLPTVRASLESSGQGLKAICDAATKTVAPNTKGVWEEIAKGAIEPVVKAVSDGVGGLWAQRVEKDRLALETKKAKLEVAKWPALGEIAAE
jgi:hypothetical protein